VVRPGPVPCGTWPALAWDRAAPRGSRPDLLATVMGSVEPARRFHALRASRRSALRAAFARGGPPRAFASLPRSIAAPPHRPVGRSRLSDDASSPGLRCRTTHAGAADPLRAGRPAPCRAACEVWSPPSRRPPPSLPAPCGVGASFGFSLQGLLLTSIGSPLGGLLPSWRCPRGFASPPWGACERGRLQGVDPDVSSFRPSCPEGRDAPMPSWDSSLQSVLPLPPTHALWIRAGSPHTPGRIDVSVRSRLRVLRWGEVGWPLSGLPALLGFAHLPTSSASLRSGRGAGSWLRLEARARCRRRAPLCAPTTSIRRGLALPPETGVLR
jgi:hypothetical protein